MQLWRDSFTNLLNSLNGIKVVSVACDGEELFQVAKKIKFDIVMLDLEMRFGLNGIDTLKKAKLVCPEMKIIMMSTHHDQTTVDECIKLGAKAYLSKNTEIPVMLDQIYKVYFGEDCTARSYELLRNF